MRQQTSVAVNQPGTTMNTTDAKPCLLNKPMITNIWHPMTDYVLLEPPLLPLSLVSVQQAFLFSYSRHSHVPKITFHRPNDRKKNYSYCY